MPANIRAPALLLAALCPVAPAVLAAGPWTIAGQVIHVEDGDTLTILQGDLQTVVRLSDIDAPETAHGHDRPGQAHGQESRRSLALLAQGRQAAATCYERDRWQRSVCTVWIDGLDLNAEQLRRGMAWMNLNRAYVRNPQSPATQAQARAAGVGLWSAHGPTPLPPWQWRQRCWKYQVCDGAGD